MKVGIIGAGNVATHLVKGLVAAGVEVTVIYSRTLVAAQELAAFAPKAQATNSLQLTQLPPADIYLMAVPDQALPQLAQQLALPAGSIIAHTSGTQPIQVLQNLPGVTAGVFYPLQTFSKVKEIDWRQIPVCVEGASPDTEVQLFTLAQLLSNQVVRMAGPARKQLHLAAVFACNFTNHLWGVAQEVLQRAQLPVNLLEPLVQETMQKAFLYPPFAVQTGPAQRGDQSTIQAHLQLLESAPRYQQLYQLLTQSIEAKVHEESNQV